MNITGMLRPTVCLKVKFGFKKKIGNLSEGSIPVVFISMTHIYKCAIIYYMKIGNPITCNATILCMKVEGRVDI